MSYWFVDLVGGDDDNDGRQTVSLPGTLINLPANVSGEIDITLSAPQYAAIVVGDIVAASTYAQGDTLSGWFRVTEKRSSNHVQLLQLIGDEGSGSSSYIDINGTGPKKTFVQLADLLASGDTIWIKGATGWVEYVEAPYLSAAKQVSIPCIVMSQVYIQGNAAAQIC